MSKYKELLRIYKNKHDDYNPEFKLSGSGCFFHDVEEFKQFSDVDDDSMNSLEAVF